MAELRVFHLKERIILIKDNGYSAFLLGQRKGPGRDKHNQFHDGGAREPPRLRPLGGGIRGGRMVVPGRLAVLQEHRKRALRYSRR